VTLSGLGGRDPRASAGFERLQAPAHRGDRGASSIWPGAIWPAYMPKMTADLGHIGLARMTRSSAARSAEVQGRHKMRVSAGEARFPVRAQIIPQHTSNGKMIQSRGILGLSSRSACARQAGCPRRRRKTLTSRSPACLLQLNYCRLVRCRPSGARCRRPGRHSKTAIYTLAEVTGAPEEARSAAWWTLSRPLRNCPAGKGRGGLKIARVSCALSRRWRHLL
jgi:hypothetical protein